MSMKWQTTQYCVVCQYSNGKQSEEYCVEQVISFQQQTNTEKIFDEVVYPTVSHQLSGPAMLLALESQICVVIVQKEFNRTMT
jgi:hypothetical protein